MVSTINRLATVHNIDLLNIINNSTVESSRKETLTTPKGKSGDVLTPLNISNEKTVINLAQWLGKSKVITKLNYKLNVSRAFDNNQHDVIFNFVLAEKYANQFVLLRGLFEFHNIPLVSVYADRASQSFRVEIKGDNTERIVDYFNLIFTSLVKEINFKRILKGIIKLEQRIKREQDLAYGSLRAAV
jgi:hypothetical protein